VDVDGGSHVVVSTGDVIGATIAGAMVAIETATETVGVAVRTATGVQAELTLTGRRRHVETLTPALEHLLAQLDLVPGDLGVVAVDIGPGLFTGLRVGVAAAKGLAQSLGIGVVGATSLDILTTGAAAAGQRGLVLACVDARRGEVFAAVHEVDVPGPMPVVHDVRLGLGLFAPGELAAALGEFAGEPVHAVGDGALRYADVLRAVPGVDPAAPGLAFPPPGALLDLVRARMEAGEPPVRPAAVVPLYMRQADAVSNYTRAVRA
jgi:tRNA threonylcarbamoyladenosine biosynthesis protein TsaB